MSLKQWWYKKGPGKKYPWSLTIDGVSHYNESYIQVIRSVLGPIAQDLTDEECIKLNNNPEELKLAHLKRSKEPWADFKYTDGKLSVVDYNKAFVEEIKTKIGHQLDSDLTDDQLVKLYVDRENIEREEPRLEIVHFGIEENGSLKIELDWNKSFIEMLKSNGIVGETEDDAIKEYLSRLTTAQQQAERFPDETVDEAFADIDSQLAEEFEQAANQIKKTKRRKRL